MTYSFRPAKREGVGLFVAIAGSSRSGKTLSALKLAKGIVGPAGKIAAIDTEGRRMSHYSEQIPFDTFDMTSPFHGARFVEAARGAQEAGYGALVVDSFSLEWSGVGGVLDIYDQLFNGKYAGDLKKSDLCWKLAKAPHKAMMNDLIQLTMPIIFCLRANEVAAHLAGGNADRWKVDQDKRFLYEWTLALTLHPDTPGKPRYDLKDAKGKELWKVQEQHRHLFPEGKYISEEAGAALQAWRNSDAAISLGSAAVESERPKALPPREWLAALKAELAELDDAGEIAAIATRWDVAEALVNDTIKGFAAATNAAFKAALDRVNGGDASAPWVGARAEAA